MSNKQLFKEAIAEAKKLKSKYQKELKSQFDEMLDLIFITNNSGGQTKSYLKRTFVTALNELKPKVFELKEVMVLN